MLLLAGLLLAGDLLAWLRLQQLLSHQTDRIAAAAARAGWQVRASPPRQGGWPLAATRSFATVQISGPEVASPEVASLGPPGSRPDGRLPRLHWTGERILLSVSLFQPGRITVLARGTQIVGAAGAGMADSLRFWGAEVALHLPLQPGMPVGVDAGALHVALPGAGPDDLIRIARLHGTLRRRGDAAALALAAGDIALPRQKEIIPDGSVEASLISEAMPRLLLREASLRWDDARLALSGSAVQRPGRPPEGSFSLHVAGAGRLLDKAVASHWISRANAASVGAVLSLIADAGAGAGAGAGAVPGTPASSLSAAPAPTRTLPPLDLPLSLHDATFWLGTIPLLHVALLNDLGESIVAPTPAGPMPPPPMP